MSLGVADVARATGVSPHTVRYYVGRGLLGPRKDPKSGYHRFSETDVHTLAFVRRAQALGFTLGEIATVIGMSRRRQSPCPTVRDIVRRRLGAFLGELADLEATCRRMRAALRKWARMPDSVPDGNEICRLIESVGRPGLTFERLEGRAFRAPATRRRTRAGRGT